MKYILRIFFVILILIILWIGSILKQLNSVPEPLQLHPENPHYFLYQDKPVILIGSTEHYGAVLNLNFDYIPYLNELQSAGLNVTRTFSGVYCEPPTAFGITNNTLSPDSGQYICPWARSSQPGYFNGGDRFDLNQWDEVYFVRLRDFLAQAAHRGIMVELVLFCTFYDSTQWNLCPLNGINNINNVGNVPATEVHTLQHEELTKIQDRMVQKIILEINEFENFYYEVCNEPYFAGVTREWQDHIIDTIVQTESQLGTRHLIAQNYGNGSMQIVDPNSNVSVYNFHYAIPEAVMLNYGFNKVLGDDETGFAGTADAVYRIEGWNFILTGGAVFNNLDYSFTTEFENGTCAIPETQPGGGGPALRGQLKILKDFIHGFDFLTMAPHPEIIKGGLPSDFSAQALALPAKFYALYFARKHGNDTNFALRWTGMFEAPASDLYTFYTISDDGVRLWINNQLVLENWTDHAPVENQGTISLQAGQKNKFTLEYYQGTGGASLSLQWSNSRQPKAQASNSMFTLPDGTENGLKLELFQDREFKQSLKTINVANVGFSGSLKTIFPESDSTVPAAPIVDLPSGRYQLEWLNPMTGAILGMIKIQHPGGDYTLQPPPFETDIALRIMRFR